jgi:hypothetical protein
MHVGWVSVLSGPWKNLRQDAHLPAKALISSTLFPASSRLLPSRPLRSRTGVADEGHGSSVAGPTAPMNLKGTHCPGISKGNVKT